MHGAKNDIIIETERFVSLLLRLRKKKVGTDNSSSTSLDDESLAVSTQTATTLENSLKESRTLLVNVSTSTSDWLNSSLKEVNETTLIDLNKNYIKTIGELKGRSYLLEQAIKQK